MNQVLILGGGIAGLAAGYRLSEQGIDVTLLEASGQLGGLGGTFDWDNRPFEKFYHTTTSTDTALMQLAADAGMHDQFDMHKTTMGMLVGGRHYPFNTPLDILRFSPLRFDERLRLGVGGLSLRHLGRGKDLDNLSSEDWMRPIFGDRTWERVWEPMFGMKFGGHMPPALYLYERLARERNVAMRAYPKVGYRGLADGIGAAIERNGGRVLLDTPVQSLYSDGRKVVVDTGAEEIDAPWALSTLQLPILKRITTGALADDVQRLPDIDYMGVVNVLFITKSPVTGHYWSFVTDSDTEFEGLIEMSQLTGTAHFHGFHGSYVMKYLDRRAPLFSESDDAIRERWTAQFLRVMPHLQASDIVQAFVFRTPFVEPVWPLGYRAAKPAPRVGQSPLFMATTAQSYPMVTSWNSATVVAERTVAELLPHL